MRLIWAFSLLFLIVGLSTGQETKGSVRFNNLTDEERIVEINTEKIKLKAQFESVIIVPAGDFTYKIIGFHETALRRHVDAGKTWSCTIRVTTTTILPSNKELPPQVEKTVKKEDGSAKLTIIVPTEETVVLVDGVKMTTTGKTRECTTPVLEAGTTFFYVIEAKWEENGTPRTMSRKATFNRGDNVVVDFTK